MRAPPAKHSMTANQTSPRTGADAPRPPLIERRLRRYAPSAQARVRALAQRHPRLADLAASFPPLLFALALPRPDHDPARAIACVIEGGPLAEAAAAADIPLWLRRLPVDGLARPLPTLPSGDLVGRRIVNHLPRSPKLAAAWLAAVSDAACWVNEPFAVWMAREIVRNANNLRSDSVHLLYLWAWFSQHPESDGYRLIATPWRYETGFNAALDAARAWLDRLRLELALGERPIANLWLRPGLFEGHDFVPLDTAERIDQEAAAMDNCLRGYVYNVADDYCRLWSIRRDGQRIATFEIRRDQPLLYINQLEAAGNERASTEIWWLATRWLHQHDLMSIGSPPRAGRDPQPDTAVWRKLWRPYWLAQRRLPAWLPLAPSWRAIAALR
jgi:hypothetical protein